MKDFISFWSFERVFSFFFSLARIRSKKKKNVSLSFFFFLRIIVFLQRLISRSLQKRRDEKRKGKSPEKNFVCVV